MGALTPILGPFEDRAAGTIVGWARSPEELDAWASLTEGTVDAFARWHAETGVHPFVLLVDAVPSGYGELWEDPEADEVELARVIVDPARRGHGLGRTLVTLLAARARGLGYQSIWVRVVPTNPAAIACYRAAGFVRTSAEEEETFNRGQPRRYVWMRLDERSEGAPVRQP